jgi:hypothetical protein
MMPRLLCSLFLCLLVFGQTASAPQEPTTTAPSSPGAGGGEGKKSGAHGDTAKSGSGYGKNYYYYYQYDDKFKDWKIDPNHPIDWLPNRRDGGVRDQSTLTLNDVSDLTINDFQVEGRDVFHKMDQVMTPVLDPATGKPVPGPDGKPQMALMPLKFDIVKGTYDPGNLDQRAVFGRNTWLLWCGGNEDFWDWLAQNAYGVLDFLYALDSRQRDTRLARLGLINQPGMKGSNKPGPWGLYLDTVERRIGEEDGESPYDGPKPPPPTDPNALESDGVNPQVYGYPSGVIGLRLFPNPNFSDEAKKRWNPDAFYNDHAYATDPRTVRPFIVGMSCAICHVSIHPLNPPADAEHPKWENLSSIIGANYFRPVGAFATRVERGNFLWQYLASQQPGCIDTSMTATDQINNGNVMNPVFELPGRIHRALRNPTEEQGAPARTMPGLGETIHNLKGEKDRKVARVLMDGADSIGVFAALARVYLNIGLFHDEWNLTSNTIIGMVPQKPFRIDVCRRNSLYWRVNENFRMGYLQDFFTWEKKSPTEPRKIWASADEEKTKRYQCSTQAMLLKDARVASVDGKPSTPFISFDGTQPEGQRVVAPHWDEPAALRGSKVFVDNCMICHSSKQPDGFTIDFAHDPPKPAKKWNEVSADGVKLTLPFASRNWADFKASPAYKNYLQTARAFAGRKEKTDETEWTTLQSFLKDNYLSTDLRIPVSLVETNAGRALGTNAVEGGVWEDYSSETYRRLPAVGKITYLDPNTHKEETFQPPGNGPGYYRVPSLVSVWTSAPLLNTNALGMCILDDWNRRVSVQGRLEMFDDAINKLLWKDKRPLTPSGEYGLRGSGDSGWIFRTDIETELRIPSGHVRHLVIGVLPGILPGGLGDAVLAALDHPILVPVLLALLSLALIIWWPRGFFYFIILTGTMIALVLWVTGIHYLVPGIIWLLPLALVLGGIAWILIAPVVVTNAAATTMANTSTSAADAKQQRIEARKGRWQRTGILVARWGGATVYALFLIGLLLLLWAGREFVNGNLGDLRVGPFPKGMPVNAIMNIDPAASIPARLGAVRGLCAMLGRLQDENREERASDERRRRFIVEHPAAPEQQWPPLYRFDDAKRLKVFEETAGPALMKASKCPDFVLDRGHYFGETLSDQEKKDLIAFLKTL